MTLVIGIVFGVILPLGLIIIMINAFGPKDFWRNSNFGFFVNKSVISILISIMIIGFCFVYSNNWANPISKSPVKQFFDYLFFIPVLLPFGIGFGEGVGILFYTSVIIEVLVLSLFIRLLLSKKNHSH